ncbi:glutamyl-tRNA reductase [soil metagenome]
MTEHGAGVTEQLTALVLHATAVPAAARTDFAARASSLLPAGGALVQTCHRLEAYSSGDGAAQLLNHAPAGTTTYWGREAARHLVRLAVGLESAVVAEDQVLHQLRRAASDARARGPLAPQLDRLFDIALRSGRRARTWLPPSSRGLAELALRQVLGPDERPAGPVLVVGAGEMGSRAARALKRRQAALLVTSRTPERAAAVATELGAATAAWDPGAQMLAGLEGVVVALNGRWIIGPRSADALADGGGWVIDLSAPSALDPALVGRLGGRLTTIDDLASQSAPGLSHRLLSRLERLVDESIDEWLSWTERAAQRNLAWALAERANEAQAVELGALWRRMPELHRDQRAEVERMARHLSERLLRDPLEQLAADGDAERVRAARELFRL